MLLGCPLITLAFAESQQIPEFFSKGFPYPMPQAGVISHRRWIFTRPQMNGTAAEGHFLIYSKSVFY
jgi:hypothetical protein